MKLLRYSCTLLAISLLPFTSARADELQPKQYADFDRYVLALSGKQAFVKASMTVGAKNLSNVVCKKKPKINPLS